MLHARMSWASRATFIVWFDNNKGMLEEGHSIKFEESIVQQLDLHERMRGTRWPNQLWRRLIDKSRNWVKQKICFEVFSNWEWLHTWEQRQELLLSFSLVWHVLATSFWNPSGSLLVRVLAQWICTFYKPHFRN